MRRDGRTRFPQVRRETKRRQFVCVCMGAWEGGREGEGGMGKATEDRNESNNNKNSRNEKANKQQS